MEVDFSKLGFALANRVDEVLRLDFNTKVWEAAERQRRVAAMHLLNAPRARDGFGEQTLAIDPVFDALWRTCYGHDYTQNKDLLKFLVKRNPEIGVKSRGTKIMVGWAPGSESRRPIGIEIRRPKPEGRKNTEGRKPTAEDLA